MIRKHYKNNADRSYHWIDWVFESFFINKKHSNSLKINHVFALTETL